MNIDFGNIYTFALIFFLGFIFGALATNTIIHDKVEDAKSSAREKLIPVIMVEIIDNVECESPSQAYQRAEAIVDASLKEAE